MGHMMVILINRTHDENAAAVGRCSFGKFMCIL